MEEIKTEPVDFVREFQEYLTQQTQHVNMISGSVCGEKESGEPFEAGGCECNTAYSTTCFTSAESDVKIAVWLVFSCSEERAKRCGASLSGGEPASRGRPGEDLRWEVQVQLLQLCQQGHGAFNRAHPYPHRCDPVAFVC